MNSVDLCVVDGQVHRLSAEAPQDAIASSIGEVPVDRDGPRLLLVTTIAATLRAFLLPLVQHFRSKGWRVDAAANGVERDPVCKAMFDRVWEADWSRNPLHAGTPFMVSRIRRIAREQKYDLVHVHTPIAAFVTRLALNPLRRDEGVQVIYTAHGLHFHPKGGPVRNKVFELLERRAGGWTDFLVVMNREDWVGAQRKRIIRQDRLRLMPGIGVDRERYSRSAVSAGELDSLYRELGIDAATPMLLVVAELKKHKRHADALLAFSRLTDRAPHLVCAGAGPLLEPMRQMAVELGIADRVHFLGQREDVPVLMSGARALLLLSDREGLPRCIMEALSMGVPVIGTRIRGTAEQLEQGAGLLVDVGDTEQITHAMQAMLADRSAAEEMGRKGLRRSEVYDVGHIVRMHEALYGEALEQRRSRQRERTTEDDLRLSPSATPQVSGTRT